MRDLLTIETLVLMGGDFEPALVINWDEDEDGDVELLLGSAGFEKLSGFTLAPGVRVTDAYRWRAATEEESRAWHNDFDERREEDWDDPGLYVYDLRPELH